MSKRDGDEWYDGYLTEVGWQKQDFANRDQRRVHDLVGPLYKSNAVGPLLSTPLLYRRVPRLFVPRLCVAPLMTPP